MAMDPEFLKKVKLFEGLTPGQLKKIANIADERSYPASEALFREGDSGQEMYVVGEGKVRISKRVPGIGEEALAVLEPGQYFGEMAVIEDSPRSADAIAHISCKVWVIERDKLDQVMFTDKELAYTLLWTFVRTMSERLRDANDRIKAFFAFSRF